MKICLINNLYKPYVRGGAEKIVEAVSLELERQGHQVFIISTKPRKREVTGLDQGVFRINSLYFNLSNIPRFFRLFWHFYDLFNLINALKVWKILKKEKPNLVITNNLKGIGMLTPFVIKKQKIKHIHILHDIQLLHPSGLMMAGEEAKINSFFSRTYQAICRKLLVSPCRIVSPSEWLLVEHLKKGFFKKSDYKVLFNPLMGEKMRDKKRAKGDNFLFVGQIEEHKGIGLLVSAFARNPNLTIDVIGDGADYSYFKKRGEKYPNIKFWGRLDSERVRTMMRSAHCLIVPSICYENSPTVVYEAASEALPVLASSLGGTKELVEEVGGVLFSPNLERDLEDKINWITKNSTEVERIGERMRERIIKNNISDYILKVLE